MHGEICIGDALNLDHPLNRGLVSEWACLPGQQRGVYFRDLCMRSVGTLTNGPTWQGPLGRPGGFGSMNFSGATQYVNVPSNTNLEGTELSVAVWVKTTTASKVFLNKTITAGATDSAQFFINGDGTVRWQADGASNLLSSTASITDGLWHRVVGTYSSASQDIYIDGLNSGTRTPATGDMTWAATDWIIGANAPPGDGLAFVGSLDDVCIWTRRLSAAEIMPDFIESRLGNPNRWNWIRRPQYVEQAGAPPASTARYLTLLGVGA